MSTLAIMDQFITITEHSNASKPATVAFPNFNNQDAIIRSTLLRLFESPHSELELKWDKIKVNILSV
jgi:hypothetical protein